MPPNFPTIDVGQGFGPAAELPLGAAHLKAPLWTNARAAGTEFPDAK